MQSDSELELIPPERKLIKLTVTKDCDLRTFIESNKKEFYRGCAFYQFTNENEDISDDKEIILLERVLHIICNIKIS